MVVVIWSIIIRFYCHSTMKKTQKSNLQTHTVISPISSIPPLKLQNGSDTYFYFFTRYCQELLDVSNRLNMELLRNNSLIALMPPGEESPKPQSSRDGTQPSRIGTKSITSNSTACNKNATQITDQQTHKMQSQERFRRRRRKIAQSESSDSYQPDQQSFQISCARISESKNIPKNYSKAILTFIRRNHNYTQRVLQKLGVDPEEFSASLASLQDSLKSISQLRSLWTDSENRYAKVYRILSMEYLRKHSLGYIFNSRVNNHSRHIKYRYKIMQSVAHPDSFTCMKEF